MEVEDQQIESIELATSKPINSSRVILNRRFQLQNEKERGEINHSHNNREIRESSNPPIQGASNYKSKSS
jgi:hypothetical protein